MTRQFTDPFDVLPAFERAIIRLRSFESMLILYYKEDIERNIVDMVEIYDDFKSRSDANFVPRAPKGSKKRFERSLDAMVRDSAISIGERRDIVRFVNFRNDIAHRMDHLFLDLQQNRFVRGFGEDEFRKHFDIRSFDHDALEVFSRVRGVIDRIYLTHYRVGKYSLRGHQLFSSTEKILNLEIKRLIRQLAALSNERNNLVVRVNNELEAGFEKLNHLIGSEYFSLRYNGSKMTARGEEFCYILLDEGFCDLSVAHIFEMKLRSIQQRRRMWIKLGGKGRAKPEWSSLPSGIARSPYDD